MRQKIEQLEFDKANLYQKIETEVTNRLAAMGYDNDLIPTPSNTVTQTDFRRIVREQGLNAALALLTK